ncbi:proline-rich extensin-like protein EPR1 isoform X2 [Oreochromis aureus]|uniref:proline-rich extensin-like protein EPR1 isoform X2 n=1 Tax=Oreochromis aureus TaxID=47969 RepID=UPI00195315D7|nr:proline-rich extensin-like protein EPR1 isoform X2 [Oreochromis aureus]
MKKGSLNFLGRKSHSLFDTNVKMKEMDNAELVLGSSATPESGTASVRARPTVKHYPSSSESFHGFAVPTPKVPLLPPVNGPKINGSVGGDLLSNGSVTSVPNLDKGEIFVPPPPSVAPPPPPSDFIPPPPDFLGDLNTLDPATLQPPSMPAPNPPSVEPKDLSFLKPPPMAPPKPPSTTSTGSASSIPISSPPSAQIPEHPKFAAPQPPTERQQKTQKKPPPKPIRISSVSNSDSPPQTPAPPPPVQTPTLSTFNPQNTAKVYTAPKTSFFNVLEDRDKKPKHMLLLEDSGSSSSGPVLVQVDGNAPKVPTLSKPVPNVKELEENLQVAQPSESTPFEQKTVTKTETKTKAKTETISVQPEITNPVQPPLQKSLQLDEVDNTLINLETSKDKLGENQIPKAESPKAENSREYQSPAPVKPGEYQSATPVKPGEYQSPAPVKPGEYQSPTPVKPGEYQSPTPVKPGRYQNPNQKYSPILDHKLRSLKGSETHGARDGHAASPLALLKAAKEREKNRTTHSISRENSGKNNEQPSIHSSDLPSSGSSAVKLTEKILPETPKSFSPVDRPQTNDAPETSSSHALVNGQAPSTSPALSRIIETPTVSKKAEERQNAYQSSSLSQTPKPEGNKDGFSMPLLPPPPEFDDLNKIMDLPPSIIPPDPPTKKAPSPPVTSLSPASVQYPLNKTQPSASPPSSVPPPPLKTAPTASVPPPPLKTAPTASVPPPPPKTAPPASVPPPPPKTAPPGSVPPPPLKTAPTVSIPPPPLNPQPPNVQPKAQVQTKPKPDSTQPARTLEQRHFDLQCILKKKLEEMAPKMSHQKEDVEPSSDEWEANDQLKSPTTKYHQKAATLDMRELQRKVDKKYSDNSSTKVFSSNGPKSKYQHGMTFTVRPGTKNPITYHE